MYYNIFRAHSVLSLYLIKMSTICLDVHYIIFIRPLSVSISYVFCYYGSENID